MKVIFVVLLYNMEVLLLNDLNYEDRKEINEFLDNIKMITSNLEEQKVRLKNYLQQWVNHKFTPQLLGKVYLIVNPPDEDGFSEEIT